MLQTKTCLFMLIGPSGVGKTTLARAIAERPEFKTNLKLICSYTTRAPRPGEQDGVDYYFITQDAFLKKLQAGFFIEYSTAYKAYYGFSRDEIVNQLKTGMSVMIVIDRVGARQILKELSNAIIINIVPPNLEVLRERLLKRTNNFNKDNEFRITKAEEELEEESKERLADCSIVNDDLELAIAKISGIINNELSA